MRAAAQILGAGGGGCLEVRHVLTSMMRSARVRPNARGRARGEGEAVATLGLLLVVRCRTITWLQAPFRRAPTSPRALLHVVNELRQPRGHGRAYVDHSPLPASTNRSVRRVSERRRRCRRGAVITGCLPTREEATPHDPGSAGSPRVRPQCGRSGRWLRRCSIEPPRVGCLFDRLGVVLSAGHDQPSGIVSALPRSPDSTSPETFEAVDRRAAQEATS